MTSCELDRMCKAILEQDSTLLDVLIAMKPFLKTDVIRHFVSIDNYNNGVAELTNPFTKALDSIVSFAVDPKTRAQLQHFHGSYASLSLEGHVMTTSKSLRASHFSVRFSMLGKQSQPWSLDDQMCVNMIRQRPRMRTFEHGDSEEMQRVKDDVRTFVLGGISFHDNAMVLLDFRDLDREYLYDRRNGATDPHTELQLLDFTLFSKECSIYIDMLSTKAKNQDNLHFFQFHGPLRNKYGAIIFRGSQIYKDAMKRFYSL